MADTAPPTATDEYRPTSGMAILALGLGIGSFMLPCFLSLAAVMVGVWALREIGFSEKPLGGNWAAAVGILLGLGSAIFGFVLFLMYVVFPSDVAQTARNMHEVGRQLALYHQVKQTLPPPAYGGEQRQADGDARPRPGQLSWRVALLMQMDSRLYDEFKLDEPWDSEHNQTLLDSMPATYGAPGQNLPTGFTVFQAIVGEGTVWDDGQLTTLPPRLLLIETTSPAPWTKPGGLPLPEEDPVDWLGQSIDGGARVLMTNFDVRVLRSDVTARQLRALALGHPHPGGKSPFREERPEQ